VSIAADLNVGTDNNILSPISCGNQNRPYLINPVESHRSAPRHRKNLGFAGGMLTRALATEKRAIFRFRTENFVSDPESPSTARGTVFRGFLGHALRAFFCFGGGRASWAASARTGVLGGAGDMRRKVVFTCGVEVRRNGMLEFDASGAWTLESAEDKWKSGDGKISESVGVRYRAVVDGRGCIRGGGGKEEEWSG
jgi:hypothetical protein